MLSQILTGFGQIWIFVIIIISVACGFISGRYSISLLSDYGYSSLVQALAGLFTSMSVSAVILFGTVIKLYLRQIRYDNSKKG